MMRILYIYGYNGRPDGSSFQKFKKAFEGFAEVYSIEWDQTEPWQSYINFRHFIYDNNIHLVIGSSLGGFMTLLLSGTRRIIVNPCIDPLEELPKIGCDRDIALKYAANYDYLHNDVDGHNVVAFFADNDELLGDKYKEWYKNVIESQVCSNVAQTIHSGHHVSQEGVEQIVKYVKKHYTIEGWR